MGRFCSLLQSAIWLDVLVLNAPFMTQAPFRPLHREDVLVDLLKRREERGFRLLYKQYAANLYGVALRIVRCPAIAQDVVQEAFVKVWRNIEAYDPAKGRLFTWLLNLVRHTALDHWRSMGRLAGRKLQDAGHIAQQLYGGINSQLPGYMLQVDCIGLDQLLRRLCPEQQLIVEYLYFKGYTHTEAAQTLLIPEGTVKTRVRLALIHLRKLVRAPAKGIRAKP